MVEFRTDFCAWIIFERYDNCRLFPYFRFDFLPTYNIKTQVLPSSRSMITQLRTCWELFNLTQNICSRIDRLRTYRYFSLHFTRHTSYFKNHGSDFIYHTSWLPCHCLDDRISLDAGTVGEHIDISAYISHVIRHIAQIMV